MKTFTFSILMIIAVPGIYAQNYQIGFAGTGASTTVDSVKVENLSQCKSLTLAGTDTLNLNATVGINESRKPRETEVSVYPNPSSGYFSVDFVTSKAGNALIGLYDMSGRMILQKKEFFPEGHHSFLLNGLQGGVYILKVESADQRVSARLISYAEGSGCPSINKTEPAGGTKNGQYLNGTMILRDPEGTKSIIVMQFNAGDTLKFTGKSGNYRTVCILVPAQSQTLTFNFVSCTDADSNHYTVVQVDSQLWMKDNMKTTRYRDGSAIPNVTDSAAWGNLNTGAYCDYHNLPAEGAYYGHLYNYYAVADPRNLCPQGWHVASHSEWNMMEKFLDNTVDTAALGGTGKVIGRILKEGCDTRWAYMDSTYGLNSSGFTALCTNYRTATGAWSQAPDNNHDDCFWTATSYNTGSAWFRSLRWCYGDIYTLFPMKRGGYSVRCIKD